MPRTGLEPARGLTHTHLKRACLPISTPRLIAQYYIKFRLFVPETGIEPALPNRKHAPEACASASSATPAYIKRLHYILFNVMMIYEFWI